MLKDAGDNKGFLILWQWNLCNNNKVESTEFFFYCLPRVRSLHKVSLNSNKISPNQTIPYLLAKKVCSEPGAIILSHIFCHFLNNFERGGCLTHPWVRHWAALGRDSKSHILLFPNSSPSPSFVKMPYFTSTHTLTQVRFTPILIFHLYILCIWHFVTKSKLPRIKETVWFPKELNITWS